MADNIPLEFENIGEYNRAVLQQLIDNNALLRVMLDYEVEKHAYRKASDEGLEEITPEELGVARANATEGNPIVKFLA